MNPFYFQAKDTQLFGMYSPATGRDEGIVICYPPQQEIMRSYQAHVQLARRLQDMGYPVLRFDYAGTGDSEGEELSFALWRDNVLAAIAQLKKLSGVSRISLLGTRLGGTLALHAAQQVGVKRLVLWDAICDGNHMVSAYEKAHQMMFARTPDEPPYKARQRNLEQCCGFPWPFALRQEISGIVAKELDTGAMRISHVQTQSAQDWAAVHDRWTAAGKKVDRVHVAEAMHWDDDLYMKIRAMPQQSMQAIMQIFEEA